MGNEKSIPAGKTGGAEKVAKTCALSTGAIGRRWGSIQMVQNVLLIWMDTNINDNIVDCCNTIIQLRVIVNDIETFTDAEQCIQVIKTIKNTKICMIISDSLGQHIVPRIHDMSQVDSIFIFDGNKNRYVQWTQEWSRIKGVFTEITPICEALKLAAHQCEQNAISISFMTTNGDTSSKNFYQLDCSFICTQIIKEILLDIEFKQEHINEFLDFCRVIFADNDYELNNIKNFERNYHDNTPIWWYTYHYFLYPMLNRGFRTMDINLIVKMSFFIRDLHRHIQQLYQKQYGSSRTNTVFMVCRGQGMPKVDFEQMKNTKGSLMSFNNFLSTTKDRNISLEFTHRALADPDLVGILFVMTVYPFKSATSFVSTKGISYFEEEDEVLFFMPSVFRIIDIKPLSENNRLFQVELTLISDKDKDLRMLTDLIREKTLPNTKGWHRLGELLLELGQFKKAQQVYEIMLEQPTNESEKGNIYDRLGRAKDGQGEYREAISFYEKLLEIYNKTRRSNHPDLALCYNNIGRMYDNMGEYSKAISYYEKNLDFLQQSLRSNHPDLSMSYNKIGALYDKIYKYSTALSYFEKTLKIVQQSLPLNHSNLAASYNNIGRMYDKMDKYPEALSYYEKDLEIRQQSLSPTDLGLASLYINIGMVNRKMGENSKAISYYEKNITIIKNAALDMSKKQTQLQGGNGRLQSLGVKRSHAESSGVTRSQVDSRGVK